MLPNEETNEEPETTNNSGGSIPFDARQGRSKLLLNLTIAVLNSYNTNDYGNQLKGLRSIHYLCFAYVQSNDSEKVKAALNELSAYINNKHVPREFIINKLDELMELIFSTYKDQFMQLMAKTDDEYDPSGVLE